MSNKKINRIKVMLAEKEKTNKWLAEQEGDNRNDSSDSRSDLVSNVKKSQIVGKAFVRIYPFNRICILKHQ